MKLIDDLIYRISYRTKTKEELDIQKKKDIKVLAITASGVLFCSIVAFIFQTFYVYIPMYLFATIAIVLHITFTIELLTIVMIGNGELPN